MEGLLLFTIVSMATVVYIVTTIFKFYIICNGQHSGAPSQTFRAMETTVFTILQFPFVYQLVYNGKHDQNDTS